VPFFFKQWGGVRKAKNGRELNGRTYDQMPRSSLAVQLGT
jgi:protein gp37